MSIERRIVLALIEIPITACVMLIKVSKRKLGIIEDAEGRNAGRSAKKTPAPAEDAGAFTGASRIPQFTTYQHRNKFRRVRAVPLN
jgi:hypothetical protein